MGKFYSSSSSSPILSISSSPVQSISSKNEKPKQFRKASPKAEVASGKRSSTYKGVTRHKLTGRFEAHLWDKDGSRRIDKKGKQVYLGGYIEEKDAARVYDLASLKYCGAQATLNFPITNYASECIQMQSMSKEEYVAMLKRQSSGFSRGCSKYRGVAKHRYGRWEARIGHVMGRKYLYLGTYKREEDAAEAYDLAAIHFRGSNAVTNFDRSCYTDAMIQQLFLPQQENPVSVASEPGIRSSTIVETIENSLPLIHMDQGFSDVGYRDDEAAAAEKGIDFYDFFNGDGFADNVENFF